MHKVILTDRLLKRPPNTPACVFDSLGGVAVRADLVPPFKSYGRPIRRVGPVAPEAYEAFERFAADLQRFSARILSSIVTCSVWRPASPGRPTRHAEGLAIDIGGVWWSQGDGVTAWNYGARRKEAIAIEAVMRMHFGTVLGPTSNTDHENHWHCDIGKAPGITAAELAQSAAQQRKVEVVYLQDACTTVHGIPLRLDGIWGAKTIAAVSHVLRDLQYGPFPDITQPVVYETFNAATALVGFGHVERLDILR